MQRKSLFIFSAVSLFVLGIAMVALGVNDSEKIIVPPIITGIGFFIIATVFMYLGRAMK